MRSQDRATASMVCREIHGRRRAGLLQDLQAHEDDAEPVVRAGLGLIAAVTVTGSRRGVPSRLVSALRLGRGRR
jgi:hypothetical protein